jgi:hypothetical protein
VKSAEYSASSCEYRIGRYVQALVRVNRLRDHVDKEYEKAPGRLLDKFQNLPGELKGSLQLSDDDQGLTQALESISMRAVRLINQARDEQLKRRQTSTAAYAPTYRPDLQGEVDSLERILLQETINAAEQCLCHEGPKRVPPKRDVSIPWQR